MQQQSNSLNRQMSNSTSSQTDGSGATNQQQTQPNQQQPYRATTTGNGSWRCEVFVDTPITRELMQGPLNIHLPPIQLPSGLQNLMGQLSNNNNNPQQQQLQRQNSTASTEGGGTGQQRQAAVQIHPPAIIGEAEEQQPEEEAAAEHSTQATFGSTASPSIYSWSRASSTPAVMNSSGSSTGESFVIDIDEDQQANQIHRRRSSSPVRSGSRNFAASTSVAAAPNSSPSEPQLTLRNPFAANSRLEAIAGRSADASNSTENGGENGQARTENGGDGAAAAGGDEEPNLRTLRMRLQELVRRRHQIFRNIVQQSGEFPSLYLVGVLLSWLLVLIFVLIQFFAIEFTACLALLFSFFHYGDVLAFKRFVSGTGNYWMIAAKVLFRQFIVLQVLGQAIYVFPTALYQETVISAVPTPTFWSTLYVVIITEYFILDCMLGAKLIVAKLPKFSALYKRRLYQWIEYTAALYRFTIPFVQWNAYLGALWWTVLYGGVKILLGFAMAWGWLLTTLRIFRATHLGSSPTEAEKKQQEQCTICYAEFVAPIKLKCSHIFCSECIRTWLDREHTCPICRAVVTKEDNNYRNGESMFPALF